MQNTEDRKWLYEQLKDNGYEIGSQEEFESSLDNNEEDAKWYHEQATSLGLEVGNYEDFGSLFRNKSKESPFGINANIPTVAETARGMVNGVNVNPFASLPNQSVEPITEFGEGVKEGGKQLVAGAEFAAGETLRPIVGTSEDDKAALERIESLEKEGKDVAKNVQSTATISPAMALGLKVFGPKGSSDFVRTMEKTAEANIAAQKALKEADGNVEQAKAILEEKANKQTIADTLRKDAERKMAEARPTKGWGWVGSMIPQMVGTGVGLGMTAVTKNPMWAQAIGIGNMAGLTTSAAGSAMAEARQAGASNAEVWTAGLLNGVIENVSERFALGKYTKGLVSAAKKSGSQAVKDAVAEVGSPARKELAKLLDKANKQLDGKLLSGKNVEDYIVQVWDETLSEGAAEALQTVAPMLYQNPDEYPNLWGIVTNVANNTLEGMKGGFFMGSILGGLSKSAEHRMNRARRKAQGFVDVAEVINPNGTRTVVEVVKDDNGEDAYVEDGKYVPLKSQEVGRREQFKFADFERGQFQNEQDESYDVGKTLETTQEMKDANTMLEKTSAVVRGRNGLGEDGDVDAFLGENPLEKAAKMYDEDEVVGQEVLDYINAKATLVGIIDKAKGQIKTEVEQAEAMIDSRKSLSDGMIHPAVMKTNDRQVYVINGNVERFDDGNVDTQKSSDSIIVMDATTGKKEFASPKDLLSIDVAIDPEVEKKAVRTTIGERIATDVENKLNGVLAFNPNDTYEVLNPQGERTTIQVVSDNGDGTINVIMGDVAETKKVTKNAVQTMADNLNSQRADEMLQGRNEMLQSEKLQKEAEQMAVPTATETPAEAAPAPRVVPTTKDGKPDFNAMDAEMFVEEYTSRYGEENTAKIARKNIAVEREKIAKLDKKIDDVTDPNQIDALYEQRQASEAVVNRYNEILERLGLSEDANETEADQKSRLRNEANNRIASLFPDGMPNVESFILADIATGNRLRWSDKKTNGVVTSRGLGAELGLSETERIRRLPLIGKDAMTPEEYAETLRERLDAVGIRYDESSLRDAVLDVYGSVDSRKGAWDALENISKKMQEPQADMDWEDMQQQLAYNKAQENVDNTPELPSLDTIEEETPISEGEYAEMEQQAQAEEQADYDAMMEENPPVEEQDTNIEPTEAQKQEISQENAEPSGEKTTPTILSEEDYVNAELVKLKPDEMSMEDWEYSDEYVDAYNKAVDAYPNYIKSLADSGALQEAFDKGTLGEQIAIRKNIQTAGFEVADILDTGNSKKSKGKKTRGRELMENLGLTKKEDARRKPLRERASMWEDKVGVKVNLIEDFEDIPTDAAKRAIDEGQRVTGWVVNGEVLLYMPYIANRTEVDKTYIHEVVAHIGMKNLLGKEGYKAFCERVFNEVMSDAEREFYRNYPNVENDAQAADEFIAHLAEDVNMDATVWQKIARIFRDILRKMGIDTRITNADIQDLLRESYLNLAEQNGEIANINENETSRFMVTDRNVQNVILKDTEERKLPTTRKEAFEYIPERGVSFYNKDVNANIKVSRKAVKHTSLHNQQDAYAIFAGMEDIIGNSVKIGNIPVAADEVGHTHSVSVMYVPVNINGTQYSARLIIKELENKGVVLEELSLYNVSMHKEKSSAVQPLNASNEVGGITAKPYSFYKIKDLIHNSQEIDKKILGLNENTRFRVKDDATETIFAAAKEKFGITYDMREAGYILPDGSMLDFSGKHEIRGADTSFLNGHRYVDHRAIQEIAYDFDENETGVETDMGDFLDRGAIRIDYNAGVINLNVAPTKAQKDRLKRLIERNDGDVYIDFGKGWDTEHYVEYESARASRVLADIDRYFNEGIKPSGNIRFRTAESAPVFYSNAEYAVKAVKQDKATPEQWLKMIEKNGGLKAGEDKWLGLSDWLKSSDKKTLTKQEVLDFIKENQIQIEEVVYGDVQDLSAEDIQESDEFAALVDSLTDYEIDENGDEYPYINRDRYQELRNGSWNFSEGFSVDYWGEGLDIDSVEAAAEYLGISTEDRNINETRLKYTTDGLENKREIALVVPTIESWNAYDDVHFGDAGNGRAIAWVRFGETKVPIEKTIVRRVLLDAPYKDVNGNDVYKIKETRSHFIVNKKLSNGERKFVPYVNDKPIGTTIETAAFDTLEEASMAMQNYYQEHPYKYMENQRVLVIDEVQSNRHQEGREKGYRPSNIEQYLKDNGVEVIETGEFYEFHKNGELDKRFSKGLLHNDINRAKQMYVGGYVKSDIPSAPFEKNWAELAMKRMLRYAAENGFDKVAWTTGEQQADRYSLAKVYNSIEREDNPSMDGRRFVLDGANYDIVVANEDGIIVESSINEAEGKSLSDLVGKDLAVKMMSLEDGDNLDSEEIRIGGEGMKAFYDQMIPSFMNKYGKKWGVKVGEVTMPSLEENNTMHSIDVTDAMRESVMQGQPLFRTAKTNYESQFSELQSEYDALDKNDEKALNEWRDKKVVVVNDYLQSVAMRFGMKPEIVVFNGADEAQMQDAYKRLEKTFLANNATPPTYEEFAERSLNKKIFATYRKGGDIITLNISTKDLRNSKERYGENLFHENAHHFAHTLYNDNELADIWKDAAKGQNSIVEKINTSKLYKNKSDSSKGNEFLARAIGALAAEQKPLFQQFVRGENNITADDVAKKLNIKQRKANFAITEILNKIKDEYQETRQRGEDNFVGGVRNDRPLRVGRRGIQGDVQRRAEGRTEREQRGRLILGAATDLAESLGVKLNVIEDVNEITDSNTRRQRAKRGAKAWYDVNTDQVYFVAPNATSIEDAQMSVLHEVVAHKGLRDVVGRENFNKFLDKVFYYAEKEIRSRIVRLASQYGWNFRVATEEYLASLAEEGFDSRENRTFLQKVRDFFMDMLREAKIAIGFNISDNDMRYMLWRTYQMQKSQGAMAVAGDVLMQQKMGVGNFRTRTSAQIERDYPNWLDGTTTESGKHSTQVEGTRKTYNKVGDWIEQNMGKDVAILDASSGMGYGTADLRERGFNIEDVEPYQSEERKKKNPATYSSYADIDKKYDYIISNAVLNVIPDDWRTDVLHNMADLMADGGKMFINTRKAGEEKAVKDKIELDIPQEVLVKRNGRIASYQRFFTPSELKAWVEQELGDGFEVEIANKKNSGTSGLAAVVVNKIGDDVRFRTAPKSADIEDGEAKGVREAFDKKVRSAWYQTKEAMYDNRQALKEYMRLATKAHGANLPNDDMKHIEAWENPYMAIMQKSSINEKEVKSWEKKYYHRILDAIRPISEASKEKVKALANVFGADSMDDILNNYLQGKHGLERNRDMAVSNALNDMQKETVITKQEAEQRLEQVNDELKNDIITPSEADAHRQRINNLLTTKKYTKEQIKAQTEAWVQRRDNIRKDDSLSWAEKQRALDLLATTEFGIDLAAKDYSGLGEVFPNEDGKLEQSIEDAYKAVEAFEMQFDTKELWDAIRAANNATLEKSFRSGIISKATMDSIRNMYEYYIPLRGFEAATTEDVYGYLNNEPRAFSMPVKRANGRASKAEFAIPHILQMAHSAILQGNNNLVKMKMANFAEHYPTDLIKQSNMYIEYDEVNDVWKAKYAEIPRDATPEEVDALIAEHNEKMAKAVKENPNKYRKVSGKMDVPYIIPKGMDSYHQIPYKRNGVDYVLTVNGDPRLAFIMNGELEKAATTFAGKAGEAVEGLTRYLSSMYTQYNPEFMLSNAFRDGTWVLATVPVRENAKYTAKFYKNYLKFVLPSVMQNLFARYENGTLDMSKETHREFANFMQNGGETGYAILKDVENTKKRVSKDIHPSLWSKTMKLIDKLGIVGRGVESSARFAAYLTSREEGRSITRSAYDAKEVSVNFNRKGAGAAFNDLPTQTLIGQIAGATAGAFKLTHTFFNAGMQGLAGVAKLVEYNPFKAMTAFSSAFLLGMVVASLFDDDDEDYYNLSETARRQNIIFRVGDDYVSIPLAIELRAMYGLGEMMVSMARGKEDVTEHNVAYKIANQIMQAFPINVLEGKGGLEALIPTAATLVTDVMQNEDWQGVPIYREDKFAQDEVKPEWQMVYNYTGRGYIAASKLLSEVSGGDEGSRGAIEINPAKVQFIAEGILGGPLTFFDKTMAAINTAMGKQEFEWRNIPFASRLMKDGGGKAQERATNREYQNNKEAYNKMRYAEKTYEEIANNPNRSKEDREKYSLKLEELRNSPEYEQLTRFHEASAEVEGLYQESKEGESLEENIDLISELKAEANAILEK